MRNAAKRFYEFGHFRLDLRKHRLLRDGELVALPPKAVETLLVLAERAGKVVEREELMEVVWANSFVEDANLTVAVSHLRKVLSQNGEAAEYIETIPRVGYRFVADVREVREEPAPLIMEKRTLSRTVIEEEEIQPEPSEVVPVVVPSTREISQAQSKSFVRRKLALAAASVALVVAAVAGLFWTSRGTNSVRSPTAPIKSIAVLPFKVVGEKNGGEHQGLGMADLLITRLSNIRELDIRPTSAVMTFNRPEQDSITAGQMLSVDAVLEGTIYRANGRVRVTARLVKVSDQSSLWAGQFEKPLQDELRLQDEITLQVVDALVLSLSGNERNALTKRFTENADAYQLYLKGRYHWNKRSWAGMVEAERLFRNAIERDPNFALAFVGLADTLGTRADATEALVAVEKALELDPNLAEAHATLGFIQMFHNWQWREAETSFKKSIELNPGYATAHHWYATLLAIQGRNAEAKAEMRRALEINPLSYNFLADLGQIYYFNREYERAEEYCRQALAIHPDFVFAHGYLHEIYLKTGEYGKAVEAELAAQKINSTFANESAVRKEDMEANFNRQRKIYEEGGIKDFVENLIVLSSQEPTFYYLNATRYAFLGEREKALDNLEKATAGRAFLSAFVKADPAFDNLRDEPRYQAILANMGLNEL